MARTARTLSEMTAEVRQRADMVNSTFVTDAEIERWINLSLSKLYDKLIKAKGVDWYLKCYETTTSTTENTIELPKDFYQLVGVDAKFGGWWRTLGQLQFQGERNKYENATIWSAYGIPAKYMFQGQTRLRFYPAPSGTYDVRVWYVPLAPILSTSVDTVSLTVTGTSGESTLTASSALDATQLYPYMQLEDSGTPYVVDVKNTTIYLDSALTGNVSGSKNFDDADRFDGINGWEEYLVIDAAIRALTKEESDPSALMVEKAEIEARLQEMADSRDKGRPKRLQDVIGDVNYDLEIDRFDNFYF